MGVKIISTGSYVPKNVVRNESFLQFPQDRLHLIAEKTGILERRHADESECTSDLAAKAAIAALEQISMKASELDGVIVSTSSPDRPQPATAVRVQKLIGAENAFAFDINSVCSGGVYGLQIASAFIESHQCNRMLVIGSEIYSRYLNPQDFSTYPYFGDGAGCIILERSDSHPSSKAILKTAGEGDSIIQVPGGGTMMPWNRIENNRDKFFQMNGKKVYEYATDVGSKVIMEALDANRLQPADINHFICHQANINIIKEIAKRLSVDPERFPMSLQRYGNTASASCFITLDEVCRKSSLIDSGATILFVAFGGGLSSACKILRF